MTLSAVLLAGGESRRMGTDKARLIFEGEPLWQRQVRLLRLVQPKRLYLAVRNEPAWRSPEMELVLDSVPSQGPISGISATLARMETSHLLVLTVDMPFILETDLRRLVSLAKTAAGIVRIRGECIEPLAGIYPKESLQEFERALTSNENSLQKLVRHLAEMGMVQLVDLSKAETARYRSVNTPDDLLQSCR